MPSYSAGVPAGIPRDFRLDSYIAEELKLLSRSQIKNRFLEGKINGKPVKLSRMVKPGDFLELSWAERETERLVPENIPLNIIYEDERVIVVNKEPGMVVHPGAGNYRGTLANALLYRRLNKKREQVEDAKDLRTGIVHRLDKDTSGVIIAAWDDEALACLCGEFKARRARKTYAAIVSGRPPEKKGRIETMLCRDKRDRKRFTVGEGARGKYALTLYKTMYSWGTYSLLMLRPKTGRTHQLRVHLKYLGCPVAADPLYGFHDKIFAGAALMLHAKRLAIRLPGTEKLRRFDTPLPERFYRTIRMLNALEKRDGMR